jgi:hypothetical protein
MSWLRSVSEQKDFQGLVKACSGVKSTTFEADGGHGEGKSKVPFDLELVDIEIDQVNDLTAMRARPHVVPYRRFIYVGEVSLDRKQRDKLGAAVSNFLYLQVG